MEPMTLREVLQAVEGNASPFFSLNRKIYGVSTDSRGDLNGKLFIPLIGERFDGHDFIDQAFENGAVACLSHRPRQGVIYVKHTGAALKELASYYRGLFSVKVVAITGSAGKTSTKDFTASVLGEGFNVLKTEGNYNNEIGLPLTIFQLDKSHEVAVLELGMNHFGELHNLSRIARPDIALITNIGFSHIENLGSQEGILKAKREIFDYLKPTGLKIINGDDTMLAGLHDDERPYLRYGLQRSFEFFAEEVQDMGWDGSICRINGFPVHVPIPGRHMLYDALAAAAVGLSLGLQSDKIQAGIEKFRPSKMRMERITTGCLTIINDAYNSNPAAMTAALDVLARQKGNRVCILGDMLELGNQAEFLHHQAGRHAADAGIEKILCAGPLAKHMYEGALDAIGQNSDKKQEAVYFGSQELMLQNLNSYIQVGDSVLVKASRGMRFEQTVEWLKECKEWTKR